MWSLGRMSKKNRTKVMCNVEKCIHNVYGVCSLGKIKIIKKEGKHICSSFEAKKK